MQNYRQALDDQLHMNIIDRALIADQSSHLQSLLYKTDSMSMANGVEIRVPFLDKRIMDFASSCDKKLLVPEFGATKPLLRKAANMLGAPAEVLYGEKKGFNSPISTLLRGSLKNLANHLIFTPGLAEPFFKPLELQALWAEHLSAKKNHAYALWPIIHFLLWRETRSIE
jgi:asparagine synthase (glutamine-hydrolysing)